MNAMHAARSGRTGIRPAIAVALLGIGALGVSGASERAVAANPAPAGAARGRPMAEPERWAVHLPIALDAAPATGPAASPTTQPAPSPTPAGPSETGLVETRDGPVAGTSDGGAWRFLGIPYAAPPVGPLRWRPPASVAPWTEPLVAGAFGSMCPQYDDGGAPVGAEDCLTLNVWAPQTAQRGGAARPVLFFLHGGGHEQGSSQVLVGDEALYDGRALAEDHGIVVVVPNYRLGPFGFLAHPALSAEGGETASGNYGALDQLAALRWAHDNAAAFGGDPSRITVFGQSAGAVGACRLVASPLAAGLLHGAILMSGACVATPLARAETNGRAVAAALGCADASDVPACLRAQPAASVLDTLEPAESGTDSLGRMAYDGVIDGSFLPDAPRALIAAGRHAAVPAIVGATSAENGRSAPRIATEAEYEAAVRAYARRSGLPAVVAERALAVYPAAGYPSPRDAYVALTSDVKFVCQARTDARLLAAGAGGPVYRYLFDHVADNAGAQARAAGAAHGLELPFLFGVLEFGVGVLRYRPGPGDVAVSAAMQGYWARFAAIGDPNGEAAAPWPRYRIEDDPYLVLASEPRAAAGLRSAQCDFWDGLAAGATP